MFRLDRRRSVAATGEILQDGKAAYESILKAISQKTRVKAQELAWANAEDNPYLMLLFGKLAEIQFMCSEAEKQMAEKFLEVNKAFLNIFQEDRILEETKKEHQNYLAKLTKLQKQLEAAKKRNDHTKFQNLENETSAQGKLYNQMTQSVEAKSKKLELYKISLLKRGLRQQAEGVLTLSGHCQQLYAAQMQLIDLLPDAPPAPAASDEAAEKEKEELDLRMTAVVNRVSSMLDIATPHHGGITFRKNKLQSPASSPALNRQSLVEPFSSLFNSRKDASKAERRSRHSSCSIDKLDQILLGAFEPNSNGTRVEDTPRSSSGTPPPIGKASVYCEIVIPALHTSDRPTLAKSKSETSVNHLHLVEEDEIMSSRFDQRLKEAGLLDRSGEYGNSAAPFGSTEDMTNVDDPGYALLTVLPTGPIMGKGGSEGKKNLDSVNTEEESGYANPADALKSSPRLFNLQSSTPSPPMSPSPVIVEPVVSHSPSQSPSVLSQSPSTGRGSSPYESVNDIRKMREKQMKEKEVTLVGVTPTGEGDYSRPFDALNSYHQGSDASSRKPLQPLTWLRTNSNGKSGKEASARALHHVVSPSSSKGSLDGVVDELPLRGVRSASDLPLRGVRSASTSAANPKVAIKPPLPSRNGGSRSPVDITSPVGSKHGNLTSLDESGSSGGKVSRYILQVENKDTPSRGETGRTRSIDSALYTPAKVTKLRNGREKVTLISGKPTGASKPTKTSNN